MKHRIVTLGMLAACATFFVSSALSAINRVRVVNKTDSTVYIHKGGFAPAVRIPAGKWRIFYYPFYVIPPGQTKKTPSSLLVATAGGRWMTTPNGFTYLSKPKMIVCLDYQSSKHTHKTGNRMWTIKKASGIDQGCKIKGYKQPWYRPSNSN